jgi:hypothetical protein
MGKNAPFGRPGALDRLRLWWYAKDRSFRANSLFGLAVGGVAVGLVAAAVSREPPPTTGLANAARPYLTTGSLPNPPLTVDIRAAGVATPLGLPDQSSTTSSTVASVPAPTSTTSLPPRPATTATTSPPSAPATTTPSPAFVYTEVPVPPPATDPTVPPLPTTTRPPTTAAPSTTSPTTAVTLLPPISLPPLPPLLP